MTQKLRSKLSLLFAFVFLSGATAPVYSMSCRTALETKKGRDYDKWLSSQPHIIQAIYRVDMQNGASRLDAYKISKMTFDEMDPLPRGMKALLFGIRAKDVKQLVEREQRYQAFQEEYVGVLDELGIIKELGSLEKYANHKLKWQNYIRGRNAILVNGALSAMTGMPIVVYFPKFDFIHNKSNPKEKVQLIVNRSRKLFYAGLVVVVVVVTATVASQVDWEKEKEKLKEMKKIVADTATHVWKREALGEAKLKLEDWEKPYYEEWVRQETEDWGVAPDVENDTGDRVKWKIVSEAVKNQLINICIQQAYPKVCLATTFGREIEQN